MAGEGATKHDVTLALEFNDGHCSRGRTCPEEGDDVGNKTLPVESSVSERQSCWALF